MKGCKIAVLDDYQDVALESADWSMLRDRADITVFQDHVDEGACEQRHMNSDAMAPSPKFQEGSCT
jgi:hypothetical protein